MKATLDNAAVTYDQVYLIGDGSRTSEKPIERPNDLDLSLVVETSTTSLYSEYGLSVDADGFASKSPSPEKDVARQLTIPQKLLSPAASKPKLPPKPKIGDVSKLTAKAQVRSIGG